MQNKRMLEKLQRGEALDLCYNEKDEHGNYILKEFKEDTDYCDSLKEAWIWSIGEHWITGEILASTDSRFYQNPDYHCLFLR